MNNIFFYRDLIRYFELAAALAGLFTWYKWKGTDMRWLTVFLFFIAGSEFYGDYLDRKYSNNVWLYDYIVIPVEILFFFWLYYRYFTGLPKKLALAGGILYTLALGVEHFFMADVQLFFMSLSYCLGLLALLIIVICYFLQLFRSPEITSFNREVMFWISLGLVVFYLGTFPYYGFYNNIAKNMNLFISYTWVMIVLNYIMYLLFLIGFIWAKPKLHDISSYQ